MLPYKASLPNSTSIAILTPIFSGMWLGMVLRIETKTYVCFKEIGLCAQNTLTILDSLVNMIGGDLCDHLMNMRIFTLITINK